MTSQAAAANVVGLGPRIAAYIRDRYGNQPAKVLAYDLGISESLAKDIRRGQRYSLQLEKMAALWGMEFLAYAFQDVVASIGPARADDANLKALKRRLRYLKKDGTRAVARSRAQMPVRNGGGLLHAPGPSLARRLARSPVPGAANGGGIAALIGQLLALEAMRARA